MVRSSLRQMESKKIQVPRYTHDGLFDHQSPDVCFLGEPVEVPVQSEPITIAPPGLGLSLKIPRDALQQDSNQPANVSLKTCLSGPAFKYPVGCTPLSAVYHISADSSFNENIELTFEHFAELETVAQASRMAFLRAESSPNKRGEYVFTALRSGQFAVGEGRCTISTQNTGFWCVGSLPKSYGILESVERRRGRGSALVRAIVGGVVGSAVGSTVCGIEGSVVGAGLGAVAGTAASTVIGVCMSVWVTAVVCAVVGVVLVFVMYSVPNDAPPLFDADLSILPVGEPIGVLECNEVYSATAKTSYVGAGVVVCTVVGILMGIVTGIVVGCTSGGKLATMAGFVVGGTVGGAVGGVMSDAVVGVVGAVVGGVAGGVAGCISGYLHVRRMLKHSEKTSDIRKRYTVLYSYSNGTQVTQHVAIAVSLANEVYITNFRQALQKEWNTSVSHRSKLNISFEEPNVCVQFQSRLKGWNVTSDSVHYALSQEDVDYPTPASLTLYDYPPRVLFDITPSENADSCTLQLGVTGMSKDVDFQVPLRARSGSLSTPQEVTEKPNLQSLWYLSTCQGDVNIIRKSANYYLQIGPILLNDKYGERVKTIECNKRGEGEKIIREIYRLWMTEDVHYSWPTLTECFRTCGLSGLASTIEQHFGLPSPL